MTLDLPPQFLVEYPIQPERAQQYYTRYLDEVRRLVVKYINTQDQANTLYFGLRETDRRLGMFEYQGQRHSIWHTFHRLQPILQIMKTGHTGVNTEARVSDEYLLLLVQTSDVQQLMEMNQISGVEPVWIPVNQDSLWRYLEQTQSLFMTTPPGPLQKKLLRNLLQGWQIRTVSLAHNNRWPQWAKPSPYGRTYYGGLSLHNTSTELRQAVLGTHYQYDLQTAVYAIKHQLVADIYAELGQDITGAFPRTEDYLENRSAIRRKLAVHLGDYPDPIKLIKMAITAIGFGAQLQDSSWTDEQGRHFGSLTEIIQRPEWRQAFQQDPWTVEFVAEQQAQSQILYESYRARPQIVELMSSIPGALTPSGRIAKNKLLAWLYQQCEAMIMNSVVGGLRARGLWCYHLHDAVITRQRVEAIDVQQLIPQQYQRWLRFECTRLEAWRGDSDPDLADHLAHIRNEERLARGYASALVSVEPRRGNPHPPGTDEFWAWADARNDLDRFISMRRAQSRMLDTVE